MNSAASSSRLRRVVSDVRTWGFRKACIKYGLAVVNRLTLMKVFVLMTLTPRSLDSDYCRVPDGFTARFLSDDEVRQFSKNSDLDLPQDFVTQALSKGDRCFGIFEARADHERLAAYGWYSVTPTVIYGPLEVCFDESYVYMYRGFTHEAYRGKRLHAVGMALAMQALVAEGQAQGRAVFGLLSYVEVQNFSSLKSVFRFGYQALGKLWLVQVPVLRNALFLYFRSGKSDTFKVVLRVAKGSTTRLMCLR